MTQSKTLEQTMNHFAPPLFLCPHSIIIRGPNYNSFPPFIPQLESRKKDGWVGEEKGLGMRGGEKQVVGNQ